MSDQEYFRNAEAQVDRLVDECQLPTDNTVLIVRSQEDPYIDFYMLGKQRTFKDSHRKDYDKIVSAYRSDVKKGGPETLDSDAATALVNLYNLEEKVDQEAKAAAERSASQPAKKPVNPPVNNPDATPGVAVPSGGGIDRGEVLWGAGLLSAGIAVAALVSVGVRIRSVRRDTAEIKGSLQTKMDDDTKKVTQLFEESDGTQTFMASLPKDEDTDLHAEWVRVVEGQVQWRVLHESTSAKAAALSGFRLSATKARSLRSEYRTGAHVYISEVDAFTAKIAELKVKKEALATKKRDAQAALDSAEQEYAVLTVVDDGSKPYILTEMKTKLADAQAKIDEINASEAAGYVGKPHDDYAALTQEMRTAAGYLRQVPQIRAEILLEYKNMQAEKLVGAQTVESIRTKVESITEEYADDCWGDVTAIQTQAEELLGPYNEAVLAIKDPADNYDMGELTQAQQKMRDTAAMLGDITALERQVQEHANKLNGIKEGLPAEVERTWVVLRDATKFIEQYAAFVDDPTEAALAALVPKVKSIQDKLSEPKPSYLQLQADEEKLHQVVVAGFDRTKAEREEFLTLEREIEQMMQQFDSERAELVSYEARERDVDQDSEAEIRALRLPGLPTERSRTALRRSHQLMREALAHLQAVRENAQNDVAREEARREALRRAEQARLEAIAAAKRAEEERRQAQEERAAREEANRLADAMSAHDSFRDDSSSSGGSHDSARE